MRIAIVSETWPPEINGVALTVAALAHGLAAGGHEVQLVRPRQASDARPVADEAGIPTTLVRGMRLPRYPELQFGVPAARLLRRLWRTLRPDAIYVATEGPLGWSALRAARALAIPLASGFHTRFDDFARHYGLGFIAPAVFAWLRRFHRMASATFVPTVELVDFLSARGFGNVVRLPRAVDTALFDPARRDETLRASWGAGPRQLVLIHVGRIAPEKNLDLAVRSFRAIQALVPDARYVWVGDGPARAMLAAENPDFVFAGVRRGEELARHYASADLFVFPSLTETFGNVTLEALASGVPTVAFDYGAAREHVKADRGRTVPFGDADALVRTAGELAARPGALRAMRHAARASVVALDPDAVAAQFARELAQLGAPAAAAGRAGAGAATLAPTAPDAPTGPMRSTT